MAVYGEEHINVDISKGLFISTTPDIIPDGFCQNIDNFILSSKGTWRARKGFTVANTIRIRVGTIGELQTTSKLNISATLPEHPYPVDISWGELYGGNALPQLWFSYAQSVAHHTGRIGAVEYAQQAAATSSSNMKSIVQYKDRYYGCDNFSSICKVYSLSNFLYTSATPGGLTQTLLATLTTGFSSFPSCMPLLVTYQNRIFHFQGNRVSYTEVATSGGYPENWNSGNNFFDLPATSVGAAAVHNVFELGGVLFIFTDKGVFYFNGQGSSTSWNVKMLNPFIRVYSKQSVALIKNTFIYTDRIGLYSYTGSKNPIKIDAPISLIFDVYNSFTINPFQDGIILSCSYLTINAGKWVWATPPAGAAISSEWGYCRNLYFDGQVWTEILLNARQAAPTGNNTCILFGAVNKQKDSYDQESLSFLVTCEMSGSQEFKLMYYDYNNNGDVTTTSGAARVATYLRLKTKDISFNQWYINTKVKKAYLKVYSLIQNLTVNAYKEGSLTPTKTDTEVLSAVLDNNYLIKLKGPELCTRVSYELIPTGINTSSPTFSATTTFPRYVSLFEIKQLNLTINTERDSTPQVTT